MRNTFGSTAFRVFDKVIVAILVLLTLMFVAVAVIRTPAKVVDAKEVQRLINTVRKKQERSVHTIKPLTQDYASSTVGAFRPDLTAFRFRIDIDHRIVTYEKQKLKRIAGAAPVTKRFEVKAEHAGLEIRVADKTIVKSVWAKDEKGILLLTPLETGTSKDENTEVELIRKDRVVAVIPVLSEFKGRQDPTIFAPSVAAQHVDRKVRVELGKARTIDAVVAEYTVFKGESPKTLEPFVRVIMPDGSDPDAKPSVVRAADGQPAGKIEVLPVGLALMDGDVDGGVRYWYAAKASGKSKTDDKLLKSGRSEPASVDVPEAFKIRFYTLSPDHVMVVVSVLHTPPDGGPARELEHSFRRGVVRGQVIGWKVAEVKVAGQRDRINNVDFSTGYQLLDIINGERRIRKEQPVQPRPAPEPRPADNGAAAPEPAPRPAPRAVNVREHEEKRQKLLLINERGRIKVLRPSVHGPK